MGPIGEDFLYYTLIFIIIAFLLMLAIVTFADYESRYGKIDGFRISQANADKAALMLAVNYKTDNEVKLYRVLDNKKVLEKLNGGDCADICDNCAVCVKDRRTGEEHFCGVNRCTAQNIDTDYVSPTIRLPVALKMNDKEFHPGILIASLVINEPDSSGAVFEEIDDTPYLELAQRISPDSGSPADTSDSDQKDGSSRPDQSFLDALCKGAQVCSVVQDPDDPSKTLPDYNCKACSFVEDPSNPYRTPPAMYGCEDICADKEPCDNVFVAYMDKNSDFWCGCCCI
jgi:hypothetical protein